MKSRVAIVRCPNYEKDSLKAVDKAIQLLGGIGQFVQPGQKVLLKPNLLAPSGPDEALNTHPEFVRQVIKLFKAAKAEVFIGDSPSCYYAEIVEKIYEISGMRKVAQEEGVALVKFDRERNVQGYPIAAFAFEADILVSLPKFKTHNVTTLTAAIKNSFGLVCGLYKAECHRRSPKSEDLAKILVEIFSFRPPDLVIVDAIRAMDGDGPGSAGHSRHMGLVLAGKDAVAIDAVLASLVSLDSETVPTTRIAAKKGLGISDLAKIEILGEDLEKSRISNFRLPKTNLLNKIPKIIFDAVAPFVYFRPAIKSAACKQCTVCAVNCPEKAIQMTKKGAKIDYRKCILCFCCHETCPYQAIYLKSSLLMKIMGM